MACVAAASGLSAQALDHLRDAIGAGWDDFEFANHDPAMKGIVQLPEYRALPRKLYPANSMLPVGKPLKLEPI